MREVIGGTETEEDPGAATDFRNENDNKKNENSAEVTFNELHR